MSQNPEDLPEDLLENVDEVMNSFSNELKEIYSFRDLFFENHPIDMAPEKNKLVEEKKTKLLEKFEAIDVERHIPDQHRAQFLYMKGRCCNISPVYDAQAVQYLSKAVKLNPRLVEAWNELGECYWKNLNIKEAKYSFEGGLKFERSVVALRCLSILLRQECSGKSRAEARPIVLKSVELAREAVAQNVQDGQSWSVLGNAYLCQIITLGDEPTFKLCTGAYDQAWKDPIARSLPDLSYNRAVVSRFEESYAKALMLLEHSCRLDPQWQPPRVELARLTSYLRSIDDLVRTRGKIKERKLTQMVKRLDKRMVGEHAGVEGARVVPLAELCAGAGGGGGGGGGDGSGAGEVALGVVVGSVHHENTVPFTFAIADGSGACVCVTVYNWASGRGVIIGDCVCVPRPRVAHHQHRRDTPGPKYDFKSIRVDDPTRLVVNGRPVPADQYATTRISSTYEAQ